MRLFTSLLLLAWCPSLVLGDVAVAVQTNGGQLKPGQVLNWVVSANPLPSGTLGMVLIGVSAPGDTGGRVFWPWSVTMNTSPKQGAITIPSGVPPKFYTVDVHANTSVYSPLLASSNAFEIIANTPTTTKQPDPTTNDPPTTRTTIVTTTQQTTVQQAPPPTQAQPDPTTQAAPSSSNKPTTQNVAPTTNSAAGSTTGQSSPSSPSGQTPTTQSTGPSTDPAPTPTADTVVTPPDGTNEKKKSSAIGPAIGGAIGGIIIIILLLFLWRRHTKKKQERVAIDEMAESNSRYRDADGAATPVVSPFANTFREFQPNRSNTAVSPFLLDSERSPPPTSPEPTMSSKYREAYGGGAGHSGHTHHHNTSFGASTGYFESSSSAAGTSEQLRSERERVLGEISALRSRGGHGGSAYAQSSVSAGSSAGRDAAEEEMRNRLDMLTQHVARLESALEQAVNVYDAPPTYHQAPSQAAPSQRG